MKNSNQAIDVTRAQYAAMRAWLQGVAAVDVADRWLSSDPDIEWTESLALRALRAIRATLAQLALRHEQEALASLLATGPRSTTALNQVLAGLRRLEELGTPAPATKHDVRLWFAAPLARRLQAAGVATLGELMTLANDLGRAWWRRV
ncbi:phage integrase family protein, partial [Escherichia coli]